MVCIYCSSDTQVINSRLHKRPNEVWRRRRCKSCGAVFTTYETAEYAQAWSVKNNTGAYIPFERDKLFLSIYQSCQHRPSAQADASALTDTVIARIQPTLQEGVVTGSTITSLTKEILERFDAVAAVHYAAFHPLG